MLDELERNPKTTANGRALIRKMFKSWNEWGEEKQEQKEQVKEG